MCAFVFHKREGVDEGWEVDKTKQQRREYLLMGVRGSFTIATTTHIRRTSID